MKYIVSVLMLCLGISFANAQEVYTSSGRNVHAKKEKKVTGFDPSRLIIGGGIIASFGTGYTDAGISPIVGYAITDHFAAGIGIGYEYFSIQNAYYNQYTGVYDNYTDKANIIYPSVWARYLVFRNIFAEANFEYDMMNYNEHYYDNNGDIQKEKLSIGVPCLLVGAGIRQPVAGRVAITAELLYDVLQQPNSPYFGQPVFRVGVCTGF